jgi:class 3 adenylate cyclase
MRRHTEAVSVTERSSGVRTFLIADIRGYSRYTDECGDEAAAALSKRFAGIVDDDVEAHDGELVTVALPPDQDVGEVLDVARAHGRLTQVELDEPRLSELFRRAVGER